MYCDNKNNMYCRCRVMRPPASARALRGFLPAITGYNGDNGLIRHIMVRECDPGVGALDSGECHDQAQCGRLLVIWAPGSRGELLPVNAGIEMRGGHIMLEVTYNPGTGWLYDSSGMELFYSTDKNFKKVKLLRVSKYETSHYGSYQYSMNELLQNSTKIA